MKTGHLVLLIVFLFTPFFNYSNALSETTPVAIYGPKQYDKLKGGSVTYTNTFEANPSESYSLWVQSGKNGVQEAKNVAISVNDINIISSGDLRTTNPILKPVSLQRFNKITVNLKGKSENFITVKILCNTCFSLQVQIDSLIDGDSATTPSITVKGTVKSFAEAGVTINGVVAIVSGDEFAANNVPISAGTNTITAEAIDKYGSKATASIRLDGQPSAEYIHLEVDSESGTVPLDATITANAELNNTIADSFLTHIGPPITADRITPTNYKISMTSPGLYVFTLRFVDTMGKVFEDDVAISAMLKSEIDSLLQEKWDGMKWAMSYKDVQHATQYFDKNAQERYSSVFNALLEKLPQIAGDMQNISMIYLKDNIAKYRIKRLQQAGGITHYIYFVKDETGLWKIDKF